MFLGVGRAGDEFEVDDGRAGHADGDGDDAVELDGAGGGVETDVRAEWTGVWFACLLLLLLVLVFLLNLLSCGGFGFGWLVLLGLFSVIGLLLLLLWFVLVGWGCLCDGCWFG